MMVNQERGPSQWLLERSGRVSVVASLHLIDHMAPISPCCSWGRYFPLSFHSLFFSANREEKKLDPHWPSDVYNIVGLPPWPSRSSAKPDGGTSWGRDGTASADEKSKEETLNPSVTSPSSLLSWSYSHSPCHGRSRGQHA